MRPFTQIKASAFVLSLSCSVFFVSEHSVRAEARTFGFNIALGNSNFTYNGESVSKSATFSQQSITGQLSLRFAFNERWDFDLRGTTDLQSSSATRTDIKPRTTDVEGRLAYALIVDHPWRLSACAGLGYHQLSVANDFSGYPSLTTPTGGLSVARSIGPTALALYGKLGMIQSLSKAWKTYGGSFAFPTGSHFCSLNVEYTSFAYDYTVTTPISGTLLNFNVGFTY